MLDVLDSTQNLFEHESTRADVDHVLPLAHFIEA